MPTETPTPTPTSGSLRWTVLALAIALGVGLWVARRPHDPQASEAAGAVRASGLSTMPPPAVRYGAHPGARYDFNWRVHTTATVQGMPPQSTELVLEGHVQVADLGESGPQRRVGVRIEQLKQANVVAFGQPIFADEGALSNALVAHPVVLGVAQDGALEDVYLETTSSPLAKNLLMAMAMHFAVASPARPGPYVATEPTDFGRVPWTYTWDGGRFARTFDDESGKGRGELRFEGSLPLEIKTDLTLHHGTGAVAEYAPGNKPAQQGTAAFRAVKTSWPPSGAPWPAVEDLERHAPDARPTPVDARASYLAAANGITAEEILFMLGAYADRQQRPRQGDLVRAAGFMRANPEFCDRLVDAFATSSARGREFVVDLLSSSGDAKAQAAMRTVLAMPSARRESTAYQQMLQRFAFVEVPEAESVMFVMKQWRDAQQQHDQDLAQASVYTLGSLAFHAARSDHNLLAESIMRPLLEALAACRDTEEEVGLVAALGNTGLAAARTPILARTKSPDVRLRAQAATALRKFDEGPVRARLVELAQDIDVQVAQTALRSLDGQRIGDVELGALAEGVERNTVTSSLDPALMTLVAAHLKPRDGALRLVKAVAARVGDRYQLQQQVDTVLRALGEAPAVTQHQ